MGKRTPTPQSWEGEELTVTAQEISNSHTRAATSRQHSVLVWFALQGQHGKTIYEQRTAGLN